MVLFQAVPDNDHTDEVIESLVWLPLYVEEDGHGTGGNLRCPEHVDALIPDRQGIQGVMAFVPLRYSPFTLPSWTERVCELGQGE